MAVEDQGNPSPKDGQGTKGNEPEFVTDEKLNRAITARMKDLEKKFEKQFNDLPTALSTKFEEMLNERMPSKGSKQEKDSTPNPLDHPEVKGMQRKLKDLEDQAKTLQAERDAEKARGRESALRQKLSEELSNSGVEPKRLRHAVGLLVDAEKRVRWDEGGDSIVFRDTDGTDLDLNTGVRSWIRSEDGKLFLPPRGTSGSGSRPSSGSGQSKDGPVDRTQVAEQLLGVFTRDDL